MKQFITALKPFIRQLSVNNLLHILVSNNIRIKDIRLEPVYENVVKDQTIIDIWDQQKKICIAINVFKIKIFSPLHEKYLSYARNNQVVAMETLKVGVKTLLYRYIFGSNLLQQIIKENIYLKTFHNRLTIANIMTTVYRLFAESYTVVVDYERKIRSIPNKPSMVGRSYISNIYLGTYRKEDLDVISVKILFSSVVSQRNNLMDIKQELNRIQNQFDNLSISFELQDENFFQTSKNSSLYLGDYSL